MTYILLSEDALALLKRSSRHQLPDIKHGHILEALASSLRFKSWASLNTALASQPSRHLTSKVKIRRPIFLDAFRARLVALGYAEATECPITFTNLENGRDFFADGDMPTWDRSRDPIELKLLLKQLGVDLEVDKQRRNPDYEIELPEMFSGMPLARVALWILIELVASRDLQTDIDPNVESTLPFIWRCDNWDSLSVEEQQEQIDDTWDEVLNPAFDLLLMNPINLEVSVDSWTKFPTLDRFAFNTNGNINYRLNRHFLLMLQRLND